jgi:hypothetical protein
MEKISNRRLGPSHTPPIAIYRNFWHILADSGLPEQYVFSISSANPTCLDIDQEWSKNSNGNGLRQSLFYNIQR